MASAKRPSSGGPTNADPVTIKQGLEAMRLFFALKTAEEREKALSQLRALVAKQG